MVERQQPTVPPVTTTLPPWQLTVLSGCIHTVLIPTTTLRWKTKLNKCVFKVKIIKVLEEFRTLTLWFNSCIRLASPRRIVCFSLDWKFSKDVDTTCVWNSHTCVRKQRNKTWTLKKVLNALTVLLPTPFEQHVLDTVFFTNTLLHW